MKRGRPSKIRIRKPTRRRYGKNPKQVAATVGRRITRRTRRR